MNYQDDYFTFYDIFCASFVLIILIEIGILSGLIFVAFLRFIFGGVIP